MGGRKQQAAAPQQQFSAPAGPTRHAYAAPHAADAQSSALQADADRQRLPGGGLVVLGLVREGEPPPLGAGVWFAEVARTVGAGVFVTSEAASMHIDEEQSQTSGKDARGTEVVTSLAAAAHVDVTCTNPLKFLTLHFCLETLRSQNECCKLYVVFLSPIDRLVDV